MKVTVYTLTGEDSGLKQELSPNVFERPCHPDLLAQAVRIYLFNQRQGTAKVKTRAEVSGGGRKPWRQKGTGRARHGSIRSPLWVGGGVVHGPKPGARRLKLPSKMKNKSFLGALSQRALESGIYVVDTLAVDSGKTSILAAFLHKLGLSDKKVLFALGPGRENIRKSLNNIPNVSYCSVERLNTYSVLNNDCLIFDKDSLENLSKRLAV